MQTILTILRPLNTDGYGNTWELNIGWQFIQGRADSLLNALDYLIIVIKFVISRYPVSVTTQSVVYFPIVFETVTVCKRRHRQMRLHMFKTFKVQSVGEGLNNQISSRNVLLLTCFVFKLKKRSRPPWIWHWIMHILWKLTHSLSQWTSIISTSNSL